MGHICVNHMHDYTHLFAESLNRVPSCREVNVPTDRGPKCGSRFLVAESLDKRPKFGSLVTNIYEFKEDNCCPTVPCF